ncbi:hypothetical protein FIBSPDRAFT_852005, partial [Athelia psychrophila]
VLVPRLWPRLAISTISPRLCSYKLQVLHLHANGQSGITSNYAYSLLRLLLNKITRPWHLDWHIVSPP